MSTHTRTIRAVMTGFFAISLLVGGMSIMTAPQASARAIDGSGNETGTGNTVGNGQKSTGSSGSNSSRDTPTPDSKCNASILGIPAWYNGIVGRDSQGHCGAIVSPSYFGSNGIQTFLIKVAVNFISILLFIAGYVCVGFVIFGGFKYFFSAGSPDGMSKAKSTIQNALIGLIISMASIGIVNAVAHIV